MGPSIVSLPNGRQLLPRIHITRESMSPSTEINRLLLGGVLVAAAVVLVIYFIAPFPHLVLALTAAVGLSVVATAVAQTLHRGRARPHHRECQSLQAEELLPSTLSDNAENALAPARSTASNVEFRTVANILRLFGCVAAVVCLPIAIRWCVVLLPRPAGRMMLLAAVLTAVQVIASFVTARYLSSRAWARRSAAVLLLLELPAFPLTLFALQGLYFLWRGEKASSESASRSMIT